MNVVTGKLLLSEKLNVIFCHFTNVKWNESGNPIGLRAKALKFQGSVKTRHVNVKLQVPDTFQ